MTPGARIAPGERTKVVVTADDFGRTSSINRAVSMACEWGILTAASMIVCGDALEEAVEMAANYPKLSVGLHIMLSDGRPVLPAADVPGLVDRHGCFAKSPAKAGVAYWRSRKKLAGQIGAEVKAQFDKAEKAGIRLTHVDCHHHLHMHPLLFDIIAKEAAARGVAWIRMPREPFSLVLGLHASRFELKAPLARLVFGLLATRNLQTVRKCGLSVVDNVYGLSGTGRMDEPYLFSLLQYVRGAASEIYLHPDLASPSGKEETKGVTSKQVRRRLEALGFQLTGFRELSEQSPHAGLLTGKAARL